MKFTFFFELIKHNIYFIVKGLETCQPIMWQEFVKYFVIEWGKKKEKK